MARTYFFWDPLSDNILQERDETAAVMAEYTTEPGLYGNLIGQNRGGVESQYHFDALGSTLALTDDNQQVTDTNAYSAFGEVTEHAGSTDNPFQYIGQKGYYRDEKTGDNYIRARHFRPTIARWLSTDPLSWGDGSDDYRYPNNPVSDIDPTGNIVLTPVVQLLSPDTKCDSERKGEACIRWKWELDRETKRRWPCGSGKGYIVQKIQYYCEIRACRDCREKVPEKPKVTYLEATQITRAYRSASDVASGFCVYNTCGIVKHVGEIKFFCESQTGNITKDWKGEQTFGENPCKIKGGPYTLEITEANKEPDWWGKPENMDKPVTRSFQLHWECCGCANVKCLSEASPVGKTKTTKEPGAGEQGACGEK